METNPKNEEMDWKYWEIPQKYWKIPQKYKTCINRNPT